MSAIERQIALIDDIVASEVETDWFELKVNYDEPKMIGERVSALANSARLIDRDFAYIIWGIEDKTHEVVGSVFNPFSKLVKREPFEFWLAQRLNPRIQVNFKEVHYKDKRLVLLEIPSATTAPIEFDRIARIRVGSATPRLSDHPDRQKNLWAKLQPFAWEKGYAKQFVSGDEVLSLLDYPKFFELTNQPLPDNRDGIFEKLTQDNLIQSDFGGKWNITNLGAILFAKRLRDFGASIERKGTRLVQYENNNRASEVINRHDGQRGYAAAFEGMIEYINSLLPNNEHIGEALRTSVELFPKIAVRELVANALIHQDLTITGAGPNIELFPNRIEITNPGSPLNPPERFIDYPPKSRNETIAALMRRMGMCEEQGSGIDKAVHAVELFQLPPPDFRMEGEATRVVLFGPRGFTQMTPDERTRACYQHAVLKFLSGDRMKNSTLRKRLGVADQNSAQISVVLRQSQEKGLIKPVDPDRPKAGYIPFWA